MFSVITANGVFLEFLLNRVYSAANQIGCKRNYPRSKATRHVRMAVSTQPLCQASRERKEAG
jgi:hypothetical protein